MIRTLRSLGGGGSDLRPKKPELAQGPRYGWAPAAFWHLAAITTQLLTGFLPAPWPMVIGLSAKSMLCGAGRFLCVVGRDGIGHYKNFGINCTQKRIAAACAFITSLPV